LIEKLRTVSYGLFVTMSTVSSLGIITAIGLLVFNTFYRDQQLIKLSQPTGNSIMLVGIVLLLSSVILLGMDGDSVPVDYFPVVCQLRAWLLCLGFTLAFGAMFSKVWRVHRQSTKSKEEAKKIKEEPKNSKKNVDWILVALLFVDVLVLFIWFIVDPLYRRLENFQLESPLDTKEDIKIRPSLEHCDSCHQNIWLGVIFGYKGLLLIFGLFLAYETRSMKARCINDSRYVGMAIYNVVVLCLITAPVSLVISSQADASFAFVTAALVFCCFLSMALIFLPKVVEVIRHPDRPTLAQGAQDTDQSVSKEEQERYRKLQQENEQLQQLIAARESKLKMLNQRLIERSTNTTTATTTATTATNIATTANFNGSSVSTALATAPTTIHIAPLKKSSEVRFATSSTGILPNKTRVGVGIMKHTETIVTDPEEEKTILEEEITSCSERNTLETADNPASHNFSGGAINSPEESYL